MAEVISAVPIDNAATSVLSLDQVIQTSDHVLRLWDQQHNIRQLELDVRVSLQKYKAWQETWSGEERNPLVSAQALWGAKGWIHIRRMLDGIIKTSRDLAEYLEKMKKVEETNPLSRWRKAYKVIQAKQGPSSKMKGLQELSTTLTRAVDELWIYSETVFDSLHSILPLESEAPGRDRIVRTALRSRLCSLELYSRCSKLKLRCSLDMDLLDSDYTNHQALSKLSEASLPVFYNLVAPSQEAHGNFQQMAIESVETSTTLGRETDDVLVQSMENLKLFNPTAQHRTVVVKVAARISAQSSCLRIPQEYTQSMTLDSRPESLANLSTQEHLSKGTKVELAFKVVEAGFILLGTPWFASLSSKNLLRLKRTKKAHHFCLETQTLDLDDFRYDDPDTLAETSQLFYLGVLLMEIALDTSELSSRSDETDQEVHRIRQLPLVEQSMGEQYCRAAAFYLQYRQSGKPFKGGKVPNGKPSNDTPSRESEKYEDPNFGDWQDYLAELLKQYHSQVYVHKVMAGACGSQSNVIFDLMNEPHDLNMTIWAASLQQAVDAIRENGATTQMILLSGTNYDAVGGFNDQSAPTLSMIRDHDGSTDKLIYEGESLLTQRSPSTRNPFFPKTPSHSLKSPHRHAYYVRRTQSTAQQPVNNLNRTKFYPIWGFRDQRPCSDERTSYRSTRTYGKNRDVRNMQMRGGVQRLLESTAAR